MMSVELFMIQLLGVILLIYLSGIIVYILTIRDKVNEILEELKKEVKK